MSKSKRVDRNHRRRVERNIAKKQKRTQHKKSIPDSPSSISEETKPPLVALLVQKFHKLIGALLHSTEPAEPLWKYFPHVLVLAFVARAAIALNGDFVVHPDEIMQYLEPAHRLAFGNGISYWEFYYGARFWLVPGLIAGVLKLFDLVGLNEPFWYVGGVKLFFATLSLVIPAGMYFFARRHFSELSARIALVAGAFWYEIAGFAHKPMTEFVATIPLVGLLALTVRPSIVNNARVVWLAAMLAVLASAIRLQYIPLALLLLGFVFVRTQRKVQLVLVTAVLVMMMGALDALTWDAGLFHSWLTNINFNLGISEFIQAKTSTQYLGWMFFASGGLALIALIAILPAPRRYGYLFILIATVVIIHSLQTHKEYRFIFTVWPLVMLVIADALARLSKCFLPSKVWLGLGGCAFAAVCILGLLIKLPNQPQYYANNGHRTGQIHFLVGQDPIFEVYRYLSKAEGVEGVFQLDREYHGTPGYYYLHRKIPFYDQVTIGSAISDLDLTPAVTHIVLDSSNTESASKVERFSTWYELDKTFENIHVYRQINEKPEVYDWVSYNPITIFSEVEFIMSQVAPDWPPAPANYGIEFVEREVAIENGSN